MLDIVRSFVNSKFEKEWDEWHSNIHIPELLKEPGFLKATKFQRAGGTGEEPE